MLRRGKTMKKYVAAFLTALLLLTPQTAFSSEKEMQKIEEYVSTALDAYKIPGASLAIIKGGEMIYQKQWGQTSDGSDITGDTPFLIGSLSKPMTALAIMQLVEEGKVSLDEPIQTYLPAFTYETDSLTPLTVRHLLEQTSGISRYEGLKVTDKYTVHHKDAIHQAVQDISGVQLARKPGTHYEYNSANYLLLGAIIESITKQLYSDYVDAAIFTPLGMTQTAANYKDAVHDGYAPGYESWFGIPVESGGIYDHAGAPYGYTTSTSNDLAKFLLFMLDGGDILSEQHHELLAAHPDNGRTYGFGWHFSKTDGFPFHGGATADFRSEMFFVPEKKYAAVLLTNKYNTTEDAQIFHIREGIRSILNGKEPDKLPAQSHTIQWAFLTIILLFAGLGIYRFFTTRKPIINKKRPYMSGILFCSAALGLIPLTVYFLQTPWRSIALFAPDVAFLLYCLVITLLINGMIPFLPKIVKKKQTYQT